MFETNANFKRPIYYNIQQNILKPWEHHKKKILETYCVFVIFIENLWGANNISIFMVDV